MSDRVEYHREYYRTHKDTIAERKAYRQKHDLDYRLRAVLRTIDQRCNDPRHVSYRWYGGKGIKNFLTLDDLYFLWEMYGAELMDRPSIDRVNSNLSYTFDNCRFIELSENQKRWPRHRRSA